MKMIFERGLLTRIRDANEYASDSMACYSNMKIQVFYDMESHRVWGVLQIGNSWTQYHDPNIVSVGMFAGRCSRAELEAEIVRAVAEKTCQVLGDD
ncbi:hypothetical protein [Bifidobacterium longum]|uniref:hypothetical protein n=1 Tax=Bifidobacterium longum TaxID=216816 RepID=UPI00192895DD|nr:hypothetical protein [Bifidobacterium longum]MBL3897915.1 hypothetical protein [Bifidobacterium longum subsp. suis]